MHTVDGLQCLLFGYCVHVVMCVCTAMFKSCITAGYMYDGAVMVTASHLPMNRNGLKFFTKVRDATFESLSGTIVIVHMNLHWMKHRMVYAISTR
jgi:Phosphoglucomutase/phosphomannomutase, alpha/beta/alpha domain I